MSGSSTCSPEPFRYNDGGYSTLSFVPTLATMLLGLLAGRLLQRAKDSPSKTVGQLLAWGLVGIMVGSVLDVAGICPVVKRIWTPAWVLFSGGWCAWFLAFFVWVADRDGGDRRTAWLRTIGSNSIAAYVGSHLFADLTRGVLQTHLGPEVLQIFGAAFEPVVTGGLMLLVWFWILRWMERRQILLRI